MLVLTAAAVAGVAYWQWQRETRRRSQLAQWAAANNWTLTARDDSYCTRWSGMPFGLGDRRRARNVLSGTWRGTPFVSFDYSYRQRTNSTRQTASASYRYAVSALRLPAYLPTLQVTPENLLTRLGEALGGSDIELESEEFNRAFRVHCDDAKFASDVLTPRTMQLLLSRPHFSWRVEGADILWWQDGEQHPAAVTAAVTTLRDVLAGIPAFVWHDHGHDADPTTVGGTA